MSNTKLNVYKKFVKYLIELNNILKKELKCFVAKANYKQKT